MPGTSCGKCHGCQCESARDRNAGSGSSTSCSDNLPTNSPHSHTRSRRASSSSGKVRRLKIKVCPATGGQVEVNVYPHETVRGLKQTLARKYKLHPARINLLHKNRVLKDGNLQDNDITEGSRLFLCPNMESGKNPTSAEHSVIEALRNLSDTQIHDFLAGRSHLRLAIRLNEHLLIVQLQLSAPSSSKTAPYSTATSLSPAAAPLSLATPPIATPPASPKEKQHFDVPSINPSSLLQASKNLSERIKEFSQLSQTLQAEERPSMLPTPPPSPPPSPGAVIETMQHLGKGIYSGTFSGMLDPRLQDRSGHPRRDINTIMHILHDLLKAQPATSANANPQSPSSQTLKPSHNGEEEALRDKVQHVQQMLEVRRQRRAARRQNQRPYPATRAHNLPGHLAASPITSTSPSFLSDAAHNTAAAANHPENVEMSNYRKPNMEQETVAV